MKPNQFEKLTPPEELYSDEGQKAQWKMWGHDEKTGRGYPDTRLGENTKKNGKESKGVHELHQINFISNVIPQMIESKTDGPVKVLDIGGGVGIYAEQLRKKFGDKIKVSTTGLTKKRPKEFRKHNKAIVTADKSSFSVNRNMHPDDLKWRSIFELSDYPEFDLILDTAGEHLYNGFNSPENYQEFFKKYITAVLSKLNDGGLASIIDTGIPTEERSGQTRGEYTAILEELQEQFPFRFEFGKGVRQLLLKMGRKEKSNNPNEIN